MKVMNPKSPRYVSLKQAADYFNKVLEARAAGVPLEDERPVDDKDDDDLHDDRMDNFEYKAQEINKLADMVDTNQDGKVTLKEFSKIQDALPAELKKFLATKKMEN